MGNQISFSEIDYKFKRKKTQKELFLEKMSSVVPLKKWCEMIKPFYYENGNGRQPIKLETMLKMYLVSLWYNLSDEQTEDMLCENLAVRNYVGITANAPDSTTLCKFRIILTTNNLAEKIFTEQTKRFKEQGIILKEGTIVDATIIDAPISKKNKDKSLPEGTATTVKHIPRTGIKAHVGVDKKSGLVHSVVVTPANVFDVTVASQLLHGEEKEVYGDAGYVGIEKREDICEKLHDGTGELEYITKHTHRRNHYYVLKKKPVVFHINQKRSKVAPEQEFLEKAKSRIRMKVEHIFCKLKHLFKYRKTKYRTASKNEQHLFMLFSLANLCKL